VLQRPARLSRLEFSIACSKVIAQLHSDARSKGIAWPEVCWPLVVNEVVPEVSGLSETQKEEFVYRQIQTGHTTDLAPGVAETLRFVQRQGWLMGIASNAQRYTIRELTECLSHQGLALEVFEPDLCFWSCEHGFSKPDPHVFQILSARLEARGIFPAGTTMVGDRLDTDIEPARRHGWRTWQLSSLDQAGNGNWQQLLEQLVAVTAQPASAAR
jgi:putative hydrolase of the HAD superfamily